MAPHSDLIPNSIRVALFTKKSMQLQQPCWLVSASISAPQCSTKLLEMLKASVYSTASGARRSPSKALVLLWL